MLKDIVLEAVSIKSRLIPIREVVVPTTTLLDRSFLLDEVAGPDERVHARKVKGLFAVGEVRVGGWAHTWRNDRLSFVDLRECRLANRNAKRNDRAD